MSKAEDAQNLARKFRQQAGETSIPDYAERMLHAALELEALAAFSGCNAISSTSPVTSNK